MDGGPTVTAVAIIVTALLAVAALLTLIRIVRGPSTLDRIVATDVFLAVVVAGVAAKAAYWQDGTVLPVLMVLSLLGFTGSVSVARFAPWWRRR
jgi:multicomponent Na+:H+ antiporter subunit F